MDTNEPKEGIPATVESDVQKISPQDARKNALREADHIKDVRARLYARGETLPRVLHHTVPPHTTHVSGIDHAVPPHMTHVSGREQTELSVTEKKPEVSNPNPSSATLQNAVSYTATVARRRTFRKTIAYVSVFFFIVAIATASFMMMTGNNSISGDNISLTVTGQSISGAGDTFPFQVSISNTNAVPIQSATLIVEYPQGTQNPEDGKEMTIERKQLDSIGNGETVNIELGARVFGSENEEKEIKVSVEYRITGSGATFNKKAEPLHFKIGTAPVVITFNALKVITSGQEYVLPLTVQSNSNVPITDVLVKISYPNGFDYSEATPNPSVGEDVWRIATLKPGEKKVITVKGIMSGKEDESYRFNASVGLADSADTNAVTTTLSQTQTEVSIERPFLDTKINIFGESGEVSVAEKGSFVTVVVTVENTLDSVIYDGKVSLKIQGNTLNEYSVYVENGFYDSVSNTLTWDSADAVALKEIIPGHPINFPFRFALNENDVSPAITFTATAQGQRVFEDRVPELLSGTSKKTLKVQGTASLTVVPQKEMGAFKNSGPKPPVAEQLTQYTLSLRVNSGSNNLSNTEVAAELPQYIKWLNVVTEGDSISYNPNTRKIKWVIGNMKPYSTQDASFQISITPSKSQVGTTPILMQEIQLTAQDDFTGIPVKSDNKAVTTDVDGDTLNGRVMAN